MTPSAWTATTPEDLARAGVLLDAFSLEYDSPTPGPEAITRRLIELVPGEVTTVLLSRADDAAPAEGVAVLRIDPSIWSRASEAYIAELYVSPDLRGQGLGRALLEEIARVARAAGADYALVVTSVDDVTALRAYRAAGYRTTEGEGGPEMVAFERDL